MNTIQRTANSRSRWRSPLLRSTGSRATLRFPLESVRPVRSPVHTQPPCPVAGYLWTPGYWAYGDVGYYWVPGVWIAPPRVGVLWTPGYWGFGGGAYLWHAGYWGPHVGFYGGINYGFGYAGVGFVGGAWAGSAFRYNTAVVNVNTAVVRNVYVDRTVINNTTVVNRAKLQRGCWWNYHQADRAGAVLLARVSFPAHLRANLSSANLRQRPHLAGFRKSRTTRNSSDGQG